MKRPFHRGEYMAVKVREILDEYEIEKILTECIGAFDSMLQIFDTDDGEKIRTVIFDRYDQNGKILKKDSFYQSEWRTYEKDKTTYNRFSLQD